MIMGQVLQAGAGQAPARQAAVGAGIPIDVPSDTINKVCASSIRAVEIADSMIRAGDVELVVTGGMESMSNAPYVAPEGAASATGSATGRSIDLMIYDGLHVDVRRAAHGAAGVVRSPASSASRARSRTRGRCARTSAPRPRRTPGRFDDEIVAVGEVAADESVRRDTTLEKLAGAQAGLRPGGDDRRPATRPASTTAPPASSSARRSSRSGAGSSRSRRSLAQGYVADEFA